MTGQPLNDIEQLIAEFKRAGLRELHVRHGELEIYLSYDVAAAGLGGKQRAVTHVEAMPASGGQSTPPAPAVSAPAASAPTASAPLAPAASAPLAPAPAPTIADGEVLVHAPYLGTFYRSPKPGSPPYVEIGALVTPESEICLVEVMKLFTAVRAGVAGRVVEVLAADGDMVIADQPLFVIAPV